jgi:hypothetical protein
MLWAATASVSFYRAYYNIKVFMDRTTPENSQVHLHIGEHIYVHTLTWGMLRAVIASVL